VPIRQTVFYDDKHHSDLTQQQLQQWKARNGTVILDEFDSGKRKVPVNRHRIPNVNDNPINVGSQNIKRKGPSPLRADETFAWDMDGRKFKKPKKAQGRTVTSNVSVHKVDLPKLMPGQTMILSPNGIQKNPTNQSFGAPPGKFIDPNDNRVKYQKSNPPPNMNTNSNQNFPLVDINIPHNTNPV